MIDRDTPPDHTADDGHVNVANIGWVPSIALGKDCGCARLEKGWVSRNLQLPGCFMSVQEFAVHGRRVVGRNAIGAMPFGYCALRRQQVLRFRPLEKRVGVQKFAASGISHGCPGIWRRAQ